MYFYRLKENILMSLIGFDGLEPVSKEYASETAGRLYYLGSLDPHKSRRSFCLSSPGLMQLTKEDAGLLKESRNGAPDLPGWLLEKIDKRSVTYINTRYPGWEKALELSPPIRWRVNVAGLGDVGSLLVTGLRLLGGGDISGIGIYDLDQDRMRRLELEANQILSPAPDFCAPEVANLSESGLFDCDIFVFCVAAGVPALNSSARDVRLAQLAANAGIVSHYARLARSKDFQGIFAVVSDPVDQLCKQALAAGGADGAGGYDCRGLRPEQVRGYGLGVMYARAAYYAGLKGAAASFLKAGRAFGPHGEGLVIADNVYAYNDELSRYLTEKALTANLEVRATGCKPYIAPALSSGSLSLLATIRGQWHYSSTYMGGVFMGARNRLLPSGTELEQLHMDERLYARIVDAYERLEKPV